jgi:hypothetical protein
VKNKNGIFQLTKCFNVLRVTVLCSLRDSFCTQNTRTNRIKEFVRFESTGVNASGLESCNDSTDCAVVRFKMIGCLSHMDSDT